ncbi:MAG: sterol desaturase family protein [Paracoccaceae bacterium]|nr:sterol desaturase family protein [Paracoccaceae bacterium]
MDDLQFGTRDKRDHWRPRDPIKPSPLLASPWSLLKFVKWLPHYFYPWNGLFFLTACAFWFYLTPDVETTKTLEWGWVAYILVRNSVALFLLHGALELRLYIRRAQGTQFKYNPRWPRETRSNVFMFSSQNIDNMIRTFGTGVPMWTAYEVLMLWAYANGWGFWTTFADNPWGLIGLGLVMVVIHEAHFYFTHRMIHSPFLYKHVHSVHHKAVNPSPWSSLSMHPVEHLIYFSGSLIHFIVPSHPLLAIYHLHIAGLGAVIGHIGFDKMVVSDEKAMNTHAYAHYLHHKYFEVNYADGLVPWDKWAGTWHDGTEEADARMRERLKLRRERSMART